MHVSISSSSSRSKPSIIAIIEGTEDGSFAGQEGAIVGGIEGGAAGAVVVAPKSFVEAAACKALGL